MTLNITLTLTLAGSLSVRNLIERRRRIFQVATFWSQSQTPIVLKLIAGCVVSLGSSIYSIGGPINGSPSSDVWVLDFHCHAWRKAPSMREERDYPAANVFDGKVYVPGGCKTCNSSLWICQYCKSSSTWMEVFDPKTQTWEPVLCPLLAERRRSRVWNSAVIDGRIYYMFGAKTLAYDPKEDEWEAIEGKTRSDSCCVFDNVLFCGSISHDGLKWYDTKNHSWVNMKGLKGLPDFDDYSCVKLADYGGKLAVLWTNYIRSSGSEDMKTWCAVIVLERRGNEEIWGTVEWFDIVLTVRDCYGVVFALAPTF